MEYILHERLFLILFKLLVILLWLVTIQCRWKMIQTCLKDSLRGDHNHRMELKITVVKGKYLGL